MVTVCGAYPLHSLVQSPYYIIKGHTFIMTNSNEYPWINNSQFWSCSNLSYKNVIKLPNVQPCDISSRLQVFNTKAWETRLRSYYLVDFLPQGIMGELIQGENVVGEHLNKRLYLGQPTTARSTTLCTAVLIPDFTLPHLFNTWNNHGEFQLLITATVKC